MCWNTLGPGRQNLVLNNFLIFDSEPFAVKYIGSGEAAVWTGRQDSGAAKVHSLHATESAELLFTLIGTQADARKFYGAKLIAGAQVDFDAAKGLWKAIDFHTGDSVPPPLNVTPANYPLFYAAPGGVKFSFDEINSCAVDSKCSVAMGSAGGVWRTQFTDTSKAAFTFPACRLEFTLGGSATADSHVDARKVRFDSADVCWGRFGADEHVAQLNLGGFAATPGGTPNPFDSISFNGSSVTFGSQGLTSGSVTIGMSNNAWGIGRQPLTGIVDMAVDRKRGVIWVLGQQGLFKVLPEALRP